MVSIKVYGSGCPTCNRLEQMCRDVVNELHAEATVEKVYDLRLLAEKGILSTPALEINGMIVSAGKLPTRSTLVHWIAGSVEA